MATSRKTKQRRQGARKRRQEQKKASSRPPAPAPVKVIEEEAPTTDRSPVSETRAVSPPSETPKAPAATPSTTFRVPRPEPLEPELEQELELEEPEPEPEPKPEEVAPKPKRASPWWGLVPIIGVASIGLYVVTQVPPPRLDEAVSNPPAVPSVTFNKTELSTFLESIEIPEPEIGPPSPPNLVPTELTQEQEEEDAVRRARARIRIDSEEAKQAALVAIATYALQRGLVPATATATQVDAVRVALARATGEPIFLGHHTVLRNKLAEYLGQ